jgi:hypothetical protein
MADDAPVFQSETVGALVGSPTEQEIKRREYELKRNDFLLRIYENYHERVFKITSAALAGNIGALILLVTLSKGESNKHLFESLGSSSRAFIVGAVSALFAFGAGWAVSLRTTEDFIRIAEENFQTTKNFNPDNRWGISLLISYIAIPWMLTLGVMLSGVSFLWGLLTMLKMAAI